MSLKINSLPSIVFCRFLNTATCYLLRSAIPTNVEAVDAIRFGSKLNTETIIVEHDKLEKLIEQNFAEESTFDFDDDFDLDLEQ